MLLLFYATQAPPPAQGYVNLSVVLGNLWPSLNATSAIDAVFWGTPEIFQYFDEAAKRLARRFEVFVVYDQSITSARNTPTYAVPASYISIQQADLAGLILRPLNIYEAEALDSNWPSTVGPPTHFLQDTQGLTQIALYPQADAGSSGKALGLVMNTFPPDVSPSMGFLVAPPGMQEYFEFYAIAKARAKESHAPMVESSQFFMGLVEMMEAAIDKYWGKSN